MNPDLRLYVVSTGGAKVRKDRDRRRQNLREVASGRRTACLFALRYLTLSDLRNRSGPSAAAVAGITANRQSRLFLRHARLPKAGEQRGFEQRADLLYTEISRALQVGDARITTIA
jgi:hypothetical protein